MRPSGDSGVFGGFLVHGTVGEHLNVEFVHAASSSAVLPLSFMVNAHWQNTTITSVNTRTGALDGEEIAKTVPQSATPGVDRFHGV